MLPHNIPQSSSNNTFLSRKQSTQLAFEKIEIENENEINGTTQVKSNQIKCKMASELVGTLSTSRLYTWLLEQDAAKMTPKYMQAMKRKFNTWLHEFQVRNDFSLSMVTRCVSIEELYEEFINKNDEQLEIYEEIIREEMLFLINRGEDAYHLSYHANEEEENY